MGANACYIYIRGEYIREREALQAAIDECYDAGLLGKNACGVGLGLRPLPAPRRRRLYLRRGNRAAGKPRGQEGHAADEAAVPGGLGLYGCPTTVNNVESIAVVPTILRRGAEWFAGFGRPNNTGTKLFGISGHVNNPCVVEEAMSIPLKELLDRHCGGVRGGWKNLKAVIPGGSSVPMLTAAQCDDAIMDFDWLREQRSGLGTAAVIVMDQSTDVIKAIWRLSKFYKHESCGQCTPCREGTGWMMRVMDRLVRGEAEVEEIDMLLSRDQAGRGPHDLRARRCGGLADPGPDPALPRRDRGPDQGASRPGASARWRRSEGMRDGAYRRLKARLCTGCARAAGSRPRATAARRCGSTGRHRASAQCRRLVARSAIRGSPSSWRRSTAVNGARQADAGSSVEGWRAGIGRAEIAATAPCRPTVCGEPSSWLRLEHRARVMSEA